jgi:urease accessory protein UreF
MNPLDIISRVVSPIAGIFAKREERKLTRESARGKLAQAKQDGQLQVELNDQELEHINAQVKKDTWLDEYVTVSLVSIINAIVLGGVLAAFGYTQVLEGVALAVRTLVEMGVEVGFLLEAVILSAVGLVVWRKI